MPRALASEDRPVRIGLAGWSEAASRYGKLLPVAENEASTELQRYAAAFDFVEINSSFYRQVRPATYEKWAAEVPGAFRFSVKMHRLITHYTRLKNTGLLADFFGSVAALGSKLAVVLVQLPPTLAFDKTVAEEFFRALRTHFKGCAVCEPRHASWSSEEARSVLAGSDIGPVLTEIPSAGENPLLGFAPGTPLYVRLHGKPRKYYSSYSEHDLSHLAEFLATHARRRRYVVFDNTATSAGVRNALELQRLA